MYSYEEYPENVCVIYPDIINKLKIGDKVQLIAGTTISNNGTIITKYMTGEVCQIHNKFCVFIDSYGEPYKSPKISVSYDGDIVSLYEPGFVKAS